MNARLPISLAAWLLFATTLTSPAQLLMNVDLEQSEFFFSGSVEGVVRNGVFYAPAPGSAVYVNQLRYLSRPGNWSLPTLDITDGVDATGDGQVLMRILDGDNISIIMPLPDSSYSGPLTLSGNGERMAIETLPEPIQLVLEGNGSPQDGTNSGVIAFQSVPEPASASLLLGALGLLAWRRRVCGTS